MSKKTVVIADDHTFSAEGLKAALEATGRFTVCNIINNGIDAIATIKTIKPDFAILDYSMPDANGLEVFIESKRWAPDTKYSVLTGAFSPQTLFEFYKKGIDGLFTKNAAPDIICQGLCDIADGKRVILKEAQDVIDQFEIDYDLTKRELEVLQCLAKGFNNKDIAHALGVSIKTIDSHRTSLLRKMNVNSTAALLVQSMRRGLIDASITA